MMLDGQFQYLTLVGTCQQPFLRFQVKGNVSTVCLFVGTYQPLTYVYILDRTVGNFQAQY